LPDSLRDSTTAEALQAIVELDLDTHRYRSTARLRARLSRNKFGDAHDEIHLTPKAPYKFWPSASRREDAATEVRFLEPLGRIVRQPYLALP
jgi:hypothetical protein